MTPTKQLTDTRVLTGKNLKMAASHQSTKTIAKIRIKPHEQQRLWLGSTKPSKGFAVEVSPEPDPGSVVTEVTNLGASDQNKYMLFIANYGTKTVSAKVGEI